MDFDQHDFIGSRRKNCYLLPKSCFPALAALLHSLVWGQWIKMPSQRLNEVKWTQLCTTTLRYSWLQDQPASMGGFLCHWALGVGGWNSSPSSKEQPMHCKLTTGGECLEKRLPFSLPPKKQSCMPVDRDAAKIVISSPANWWHCTHLPLGVVLTNNTLLRA